MGISDFLTRVLETAGRPCDLNAYSDGLGRKRRRRPMRLGIDVSTWIQSAAHGFGDMLGDERHLTNYGRANLFQEQQDPGTNTGGPTEETIQEYVETCTKYVLTRMDFLRDSTHADILVVLDGESPPVKKRESERRREIRSENERVREQPVDPNESPSKTNSQRTKAFRRAGAGRYYTRIVDELLKALRQAELPFLVAPYEADSQLAFLSDMGYLDLVITEDSDLVAHGVKSILYKSSAEIGNNRACGKLLKFSDIGAVVGDSWNLADFSPVMMTLLFVSVGCDYCEKLKGVGLVTASRVIREAFLVAPRAESKKSKSKLTRVLDGLYVSSYLGPSMLTPQFKFDYEERFLAAIFMYRHPLIYDPLKGDNFLTSRCSVGQVSDQWQNVGHVTIDKELMDHDAYVELCADFDRIQDIVGKLRPKDVAMRLAQGLPEEGVATLPTPEMGSAGGNEVEAEESQIQSVSMLTQEESHLLATQEDMPMERNNENNAGCGSGMKSAEGDVVMETLERSLLGDNDEGDDDNNDGAFETQPSDLSRDKPSSRQLDDEFEATESEPTPNA